MQHKLFFEARDACMLLGVQEPTVPFMTAVFVSCHDHIPTDLGSSIPTEMLEDFKENNPPIIQDQSHPLYAETKRLFALTKQLYKLFPDRIHRNITNIILTVQEGMKKENIKPAQMFEILCSQACPWTTTKDGGIKPMYTTHSPVSPADPLNRNRGLEGLDLN